MGKDVFGERGLQHDFVIPNRLGQTIPANVKIKRHSRIVQQVGFAPKKKKKK